MTKLYLYCFCFLESILILGPFLDKESRRELPPGMLSLMVMVASGLSAFLCLQAFQYLYLFPLIFFVVSFIASCALSQEDPVIRLCRIIIPLFFYESIRMMLGFVITLFFQENPGYAQAFFAMLQIQSAALLYLGLTGVSQIIYYMLLKKHWANIYLLSRKGQLELSCLFAVAIIFMQCMLALILSSGEHSITIALICAWLCFSLTGGGILFTIFELSKRFKAEKELALLKVSGDLREQSYQRMEAQQKAAARQLHDYKNQLRLIASLPSADETRAYVARLLDEMPPVEYGSHSGNAIIDAMLNLKQREAKAQGIDFNAKVLLPHPLRVSAPDICAILGNQLDNALEACLRCKAEDPELRPQIEVTIGQQNDMSFFRVLNTARIRESRGFSLSRLSSTKREPGHGYGLDIIQEAVHKYQGSLDMEYKDGMFSSTAMIQNTQEA